MLEQLFHVNHFVFTAAWERRICYADSVHCRSLIINVLLPAPKWISSLNTNPGNQRWPESGTMTLTGFKYTTQLWEGAFVASAKYHLFLRLVLVGNLSGMVENCRTNNGDHLCSHGSLYSLWKTNLSWIISHAWPQSFFSHKQFIIYPFTCMLWISAIPSIL